MATSIATGALRPKVAVALSAVLNLVGAFLSLAVAADDREGHSSTKTARSTLPLIFCGLVGGITLEPPDLAAGPALELVPRAHRRHRRRHLIAGVGIQRRALDRTRVSKVVHSRR